MTYLQRMSRRLAPQWAQIPSTNQVPTGALVTACMVSNGFTIADPNDPGQLDVVGFDTATPQLIADLARGPL
jgi:hypothetical protein